MAILIARPVLRSMIEHALSEFPLECCGLLSGRGTLIDGVRPSTNARHSPTEFEIPPAELFEFLRGVRRESRRFLGIYHSHPRRDATPSDKDVQEFNYPQATYWILSMLDRRPDVRCHVWKGEGFQQVDYDVVEVNSKSLG